MGNYYAIERMNLSQMFCQYRPDNTANIVPKKIKRLCHVEHALINNVYILNIETENIVASKLFWQYFTVNVTTYMHTCNKNYKFSGIEIPFLCCNRVHDIWKGVVKTFLNLRRKGVVILHDFVIHLLKSCSVLCVQLDGFCKAHCLAWFDLR